MAHTHLNYLKRCQILALWKAGFNQTQVAKEVGVHKSTISREFNRNITFLRTSLGCWIYKPDYAQCYANDRRKAKRHYYKFTDEVSEFVRMKLLEDWSPEQISGYAKRWELFSISHERIYQFILEDKNEGGELYKHLRSKNKKYRKRYGSKKQSGPIKNRVSIDLRPKVVDEKSRIGDWEIDTIVGKGQKQAIVTIVERFSKYMVMKKLDHKSALITEKAVIALLAHHKDKLYTITADNGSEFANHKEISESLGIDFYFAHPYSSWERGLNENTNGLVRQYIKKGAEFTDVTDESLAIIAAKLNSRPRKALNYKSPNEVFIS